MNFTLAELTRIKLEPGEVLAVKLYGDDYEGADLTGLQEKLKELFPDNKIMVFVLPNGHDLQMEAISGKLEDSEFKETEEQRKRREEKLALLEKLQAMSCGPSYCQDCTCGKKQIAEEKNETSESGS